jgi:hypothetical protein
VRAAFAASQRKKGWHIIAVEAEPTHFEWMTMHFRDNGLDPASHTLVHAAVPAVNLEELTRTCNIIDLIEMDIQGHELAVVSEGIALLNDKVKRMHIGTHSAEIEHGLRELLGAQGWSCLFDYEGNGTSETLWGTFHFQDGVQSWENPRLRQPSPGPL